MSEHTKEPWFFSEWSDELVPIRTKSGRIVCDVGYADTDQINIFNARRIVACVNACAGISTEYMEKFSATTFNDFKRMKEQRDELLAALVKAADFIQPYNVASELLEELDAAIAKVKP